MSIARTLVELFTLHRASAHLALTFAGHWNSLALEDPGQGEGDRAELTNMRRIPLLDMA
jgi:hypothetical protein